MTLTLRRILTRSLLHRTGRGFSALIALTVSATIATALFTLYASLDAKLHHEFRSFGANVILTGPIDAATLATTQRIAGPDAIAAPFAYAVATTDRGTPVVVAGTDFAQTRKLNSYWNPQTWPTTNQAFLGQKAANFTGNESQLALTFNTITKTFPTAAKLSTGSDEDSRIYLPLEAFTTWTGVAPTVIELQIPGSAAHITQTIADLQHALPALQIQPVRQLIQGESQIVDRIHALIYGSVLLIALTVGISVLATLSASVLERRRDFALMKALGSSQRQLIALFLSEATIIALAGVALGYILGSLTALAISEANFQTATYPNLRVLPIAIAINLAIAALAALFPTQALRDLQPAALLKGE